MKGNAHTPITGGQPKGAKVVVGSTSATKLGVSQSKHAVGGKKK